MRPTLNIAFSLLLLVMQAVGIVAPHSVEESVPCQCCSCGSDACSTTRTPAPSAAPLAGQAGEARAESKKATLRPHPQPTASAFTPVTVALLVATPHSPIVSSQPLYERFCLLLI